MTCMMACREIQGTTIDLHASSAGLSGTTPVKNEHKVLPARPVPRDRALLRAPQAAASSNPARAERMASK